MAHQYGAEALAVDPTNPATVYFGTDAMGIWKSTDCGAKGSWARVNTGKNGSALDSSMQWTLTIDPTDPQVLYANSGYGAQGSGAWKSANGGVDWDPLWPPADAALANVVQYDFVHKVRIDPKNHQHLLIAFHAPCNPPYAKNCLAESQDAGMTWAIVNGDPSWSESIDQTIWFLDDSKTWLWGSTSGGLWWTVDGGQNWKQINPSWGGHNGGQLYRAKDGAFYLAAPAGLVRRSPAGQWSIDAMVPTLMIGMTGDGQSMYASRGPYPESPPYLPYWTSPEGEGLSWSPFPSPPMTNGGYELGFDPDHRVLYASSFAEGFWRVVVN
jgi:hypothetical protein